MERRFIVYRVEQQVGRVSLNRPDVLNSFNREMALELQQLLTAIAKDDEVRAVLLTGEGRAFCAGQDLAEVAGRTPPRLGAIVQEYYNPIIRAIRALRKPVVCAVGGVAAGAGANLALACDLVIASENASFVQSFCKVGLVPDSGGTFFLPRLVGLPRATAMMMLGEKISARQAFEMGMIYKVCEPGALDSEAWKLTVHLAAQPTTGLGLIKHALNASLANSLDAQLDLEASLQEQAGLSVNYQEGLRAFLEKRPPKFTGR
jgi:2-(1,2-epoxy-1,2-dihydrophenyl)acetyl-CoA isomerase